MSYCLYLRKSRADLEAEAHGEGETLARHERLLLEVARKGNYNITQIYKEIVSGENLAARPVMLQLLSEIAQGMWEGVLVVEVERLARGDTTDQGIVANAFKCSNTKIITPTKVYDPNNEFDEEYFEFGLFMSRREYKTINRRLQQGRVAASKEGKHVSGGTPYGYTRVKVQNGKGWTLAVNPEQADVVRMIFNMYTTPEDSGDGVPRHIGISSIARRLDALGVIAPAGGHEWSSCTIHRMLTNPVYIGKIRWGYKRAKKVINDGSVTVKRFFSTDELIVDGLHEAIISEELFTKAGEIMSSNPPHTKGSAGLKNPLSGLLVCKNCGKHMVMSTNSGVSRVRCGSRYCPTPTTRLYLVEQRILTGLSDWLHSFDVDVSTARIQDFSKQVETAENSVNLAKANVSRLQSMLTRTHELLEQQVYTVDMFLERSRLLTGQLRDAESVLADSRAKLDSARLSEANIKTIAPKISHLVDIYFDLPTAQAKNDLLKEVLERVEYSRDKRSSKIVPMDAFEITLFPRLPKTD